MALMLRGLAASILVLGVVGCVKPAPPPYDIPSSMVLQTQSVWSTTLGYVRPAADFTRYDSVFIEPVRLYMGGNGRFGTTPIEDRQEVGRYMQDAFARAIGEQVQLADAPGPNVLRLRIIMVGLQETNPLLAASTHFSISGMAVDISRSVLGMNGSFMGSVTYLAEFYDGQTDTMLAAFQSQASADALDITEDLSALGSAKVGVEKAARHMRDMLASMQHGTMQF